MNETHAANFEEFDRLPPHDIPAERCLLGSLMLAGADELAMTEILATVGAEDFFQADHRIIFDVAVETWKRSKAIDAVLVRAELVRRQQFEEVGGLTYLQQILAQVPSYCHATHYAGIVREKAILRRIIALANDALRKAYAPSSEDTAVRQAMDLAGDASKLATSHQLDRIWRIGEAVDEVVMRRLSGEVRHVSTGIRGLDDILGGFRLGQKHIVGAKPGMGKSMLVKQIALNLAWSGIRVGIISVEEDRSKIAENALANVAGVINNRIARDQTSESEQARMASAANDMADKHLFIVDTARHLDKIIANARILRARHGCEVIIVDHLHIIDASREGQRGGDAGNRNLEVTRISSALKWCWKDLGVAGVECAQLNRDTDSQPPTLKSLRDSGSLEQDADVVILLHREDYYRPQGECRDGKLMAMIRKNKSGAMADVPLKFEEEYQRITDWSEDEAYYPT